MVFEFFFENFEGCIMVEDFKGDIQFVNLIFVFLNFEQFVFEEFNFDIKVGFMVGFMGFNGLGLSIIFDLMNGILSLIEGEVKIDGCFL